jgi:hypothetical protein
MGHLNGPVFSEVHNNLLQQLGCLLFGDCCHAYMRSPALEALAPALVVDHDLISKCQINYHN